MPNWCENETYLCHSDPAMLLRAQDAFVEGRLLDEFVPIPDSLKIVAGRMSDPDEQKMLEEVLSDTKMKMLDSIFNEMN